MTHAALTGATAARVTLDDLLARLAMTRAMFAMIIASFHLAALNGLCGVATAAATAASAPIITRLRLATADGYSGLAAAMATVIITRLAFTFGKSGCTG